MQAEGPKTIYYRGAYIRDALTEDWLSSGIVGPKSGDVAIGGCSAGGLTIWLNIDAFAQQLRTGGVPASSRITGFADAGFFLDHVTEGGSVYRTQLFQWGYVAWNSSAALSPACLSAYPASDKWRCIFAQYTAAHISTPLFMFNSRYDSCQLGGCELMLPDPDKPWNQMLPSSQVAAQAYSVDFNNALNASGFQSLSQHGGFITSCKVHCDAGDAAWWTTQAPGDKGLGSNTTLALAFDAWLTGKTQGSQSWYLDLCAIPPCNPVC